MSQYLLDAFDHFTCLFTFLGVKVIVKRFIELLTTLCASSRLLLDCCQSRPHTSHAAEGTPFVSLWHFVILELEWHAKKIICRLWRMSVQRTSLMGRWITDWVYCIQCTFQNTGPLVATTEPGQFHVSYSVDLNVVLAVVYSMLSFNCLPRSLMLYYIIIHIIT